MSCNKLLKSIFILGNGYRNGKYLTNIVLVQYKVKNTTYNSCDPKTMKTRVYSYIYPETSKEVAESLRNGNFCFKCGHPSRCTDK